jgi:hypothetical protein
LSHLRTRFRIPGQEELDEVRRIRRYRVVACTIDLGRRSRNVQRAVVTDSQMETWRGSDRAGEQLGIASPLLHFCGRRGVTLLNLSSVALPSGVSAALRQAASESPDHFSMAEGVTFKLGDRAALSLTGLFIGNQKIAEYDEAVERVARADVDAGTVFLDLKKGWSSQRQILVTLGIIVAAPVVLYALACATKGCD